MNTTTKIILGILGLGVVGYFTYNYVKREKNAKKDSIVIREELKKENEVLQLELKLKDKTVELQASINRQKDITNQIAYDVSKKNIEAKRKEIKNISEQLEQLKKS